MIVFHLYVNYFLLLKQNIFFLFYLAEQNSYELVKVNTSAEHPLLGQICRFKQPATDGMFCLIFLCI
jgi:hypothetical protein